MKIIVLVLFQIFYHPDNNKQQGVRLIDLDPSGYPKLKIYKYRSCKEVNLIFLRDKSYPLVLRAIQLWGCATENIWRCQVSVPGWLPGRGQLSTFTMNLLCYTRHVDISINQVLRMKGIINLESSVPMSI